MDLRSHINKICVLKRLDYVLKICYLLGSIVNKIGGALSDHLRGKRLQVQFGFVNHLVLVVCLTSLESRCKLQS